MNLAAGVRGTFVLPLPVGVVEEALRDGKTWLSALPSVREVTVRSPRSSVRGARYALEGPDGAWELKELPSPEGFAWALQGPLRAWARVTVEPSRDGATLCVLLRAQQSWWRRALGEGVAREIVEALAAAWSRPRGPRPTAVTLHPVTAEEGALLDGLVARSAPRTAAEIVARRPPALRAPAGRLASQRLEDLVYLHWRVDAEALRAKVPAGLELDLVDGSPWVSLVGLRTSRIADAAGRNFLPTPFAQVNLRTYVRCAGEPAVHFLAVQCGLWRMTLAAKHLARLPYVTARVRHEAQGDALHLRCEGPLGRVALRWTLGDERKSDDPLAERYLSATVVRGRRWCGDFVHDRWPLHAAHVEVEANEMLAAAGFVGLDGARPDRVAASPGLDAVTPPSRFVDA